MEINIEVASPAHEHYAGAVCALIQESARARGTGIAERQPEYIRAKINKGNAVIALDGETLAGFCYIETWDHGRYVANSGLIVAPNFRKMGLAKRIKKEILNWKLLL